MKLKPNSSSITLFFAASLVAAWSFPKLATDAEIIGSRINSSNKSSEQDDGTKNRSSSAAAGGTTGACPPYGCPLLARDMYFDEEAQTALKAIRKLQVKHTQSEEQQTRSKSSPSSSTEENEEEYDVDVRNSSTEEQQDDLTNALDKLKSAGGQDEATLTLIGYKGGKLEDQINQDRAFVISPYNVIVTDNSASAGSSTTSLGETIPKAQRLLGVFDGHAPLGEMVSEYAVANLPELLSSKLEVILKQQTSQQEESSSSSKQRQQQQESEQSQAIQKALVETFIEIDKTAPATAISSGCTASVVLQLDTKIYVANAGDSRSFIATYHPTTSQTSIVYITKEDKPHLPEEKARIEKMGGEVYLPSRVGASSRVLYIDSKSQRKHGLAMSRSIGDWIAGGLGVIPNPTVDVLDIMDLIEGGKRNNKIGSGGKECVVSVDTNSEEASDTDDTCSTSSTTDKFDDVKVFAVSATDGMLDYVDIKDIAKAVATSLYDDDGPHPLSACETLISTAATAWHRAKQGRYRDDIAIAVSKLSLT